MSLYGKPMKYKNRKGQVLDNWPSTDFSKDKGVTVQADRDDADINKIIARFQKSGQLPPTLRGEPFYGDVSEFGDLQDSIMKIQEAQELFMQYPADLRERFENDPVQMLEFLADEGNRKEAEELGLVVPRPVVTPPVPPAEPPVVSPKK